MFRSKKNAHILESIYYFSNKIKQYKLKIILYFTRFHFQTNYSIVIVDQHTELVKLEDIEKHIYNELIKRWAFFTYLIIYLEVYDENTSYVNYWLIIKVTNKIKLKNWFLIEKNCFLQKYQLLIYFAGLYLLKRTFGKKFDLAMKMAKNLYRLLTADEPDCSGHTVSSTTLTRITTAACEPEPIVVKRTRGKN